MRDAWGRSEGQRDGVCYHRGRVIGEMMCVHPGISEIKT